MTVSISPAQTWETLQPLLDRALELAPRERERWFSELMQTQPEFVSAVKQLLAECDAVNAKGFLEQSPTLKRAIAKGTRVGAYTLERLIGRGGMGEVWLATRSDGRFEGNCAIKFLDAAFRSSKLVERFRREGSVLARLNAPNIARLLDAGAADDGRPYLALEYIDGERIDRYCQSASLSIADRVRLFVHVVAAVAHAHSQLIVHRDLKPSNVLVTREGEVKLLDFGIAKLLDVESLTDTPELTRIEDAALTPEYAAPEQLLGEMPSTATDVYQLGLLLFVLLAGKHPLPTSDAGAMRFHAALDAAVPRASELAENENRKALSGDLDAILAMALRKQPNERYATAQALNDDLHRYLRHEPVTARRGALWYRTRKFVDRHRVAVAAAALTVVTLIAGIVTTSWQAIEASRAREFAEQSANEARLERDKERFAARVAIANQEFTSQIFGNAMRGGETERMRARLDLAREKLRSRYRDEPEIHAMLLMQLAGRYDEMNRPDREADVIKELRELAAHGNDYTLQAQLECIDAYDLIRDGKYDDAAPHIEKGLEHMQSARRPLEGAFECWRAEAMLAVAKGDAARGVARMNELLKWIESEGREQTRLYVNAVGSLAYIYRQAGDIESSLNVTRRKLALDAQLGSDDTISSYVDLNREAQNLFELGRLTEAAAVDADLLARLGESEEGGDAAASFQAGIGRRGSVYGEAKRSISILRAVAEDARRTGRDSNLRGTLIDLADAYSTVGDRNAATAVMREFDSLVAKRPSGRREALDASRVRLKLTLMNKSPETELQARRVELQRSIEAVTKGNRLTVMEGRLAAGSIALQFGDYDDALMHANAALTLAESKTLTGRTSAWTGMAHLLIAKVQQEERQVDSARQHVQLGMMHFDETLSTDHTLRREAARIAKGLQVGSN